MYSVMRFVYNDTTNVFPLPVSAQIVDSCEFYADGLEIYNHLVNEIVDHVDDANVLYDANDDNHIARVFYAIESNDDTHDDAYIATDIVLAKVFNDIDKEMTFESYRTKPLTALSYEYMDIQNLSPQKYLKSHLSDITVNEKVKPSVAEQVGMTPEEFKAAYNELLESNSKIMDGTDTKEERKVDPAKLKKYVDTYVANLPGPKFQNSTSAVPCNYDGVDLDSTSIWNVLKPRLVKIKKEAINPRKYVIIKTQTRHTWYPNTSGIVKSCVYVRSIGSDPVSMHQHMVELVNAEMDAHNADAVTNTDGKFKFGFKTASNSYTTIVYGLYDIDDLITNDEGLLSNSHVSYMGGAYA